MNDLHVENQEPMKIDEEIISGNQKPLKIDEWFKCREPRTHEDLLIFNMLGTKNPKRLMNDSHVGNQERENLWIFNMQGTKNMWRFMNK